MTVLKAPAYPLHWIVRDGGTAFLVPSHAGGWARRRPLACAPANAVPVSLPAFGLVLASIVGVPL